MGRMGERLVHFLPRRMYECYLLQPAALATVMNGIENFREPPVSEEEVRELLGAKRDERDEGGRQLKYFCRGIADVPADWEARINAAKFLEDAFQELSETRVSYEKTTHSVAITEWLIANDPDALRDIVDLLNRVLNVR
jgi:hypothetical protein